MSKLQNTTYQEIELNSYEKLQRIIIESANYKYINNEMIQLVEQGENEDMVIEETNNAINLVAGYISLLFAKRIVNTELSISANHNLATSKEAVLGYVVEAVNSYEELFTDEMDEIQKHMISRIVSYINLTFVHNVETYSIKL